MQLSKSEALFISICKILGLVIEKVPEGLTKTPDFKVSCPHCSFYVEVKDLRANIKERQLLENFRDTGFVSVSSELGQRASGMIKLAKYQLREVAKKGLPCVIVLYDNIKLDDGTSLNIQGPLTSDHITAAMFGEWVVDLTIDRKTAKVIEREDRCGPNESFNKTSKNYISAVAVLSDYSGLLNIIVYHNPFAQNSLPEVVFKGPNCSNFKVSIENAKRPQSWICCD